MSAKGTAMDQTITVIYEQGILRPLEPLSLAEYNQVKIQLLEVVSPPEETDEASQVEEVLLAAGVIRPLTPPPDLPHVSLKRRQELALLYATGGPLSEMVIAEREGR
jgi:predicted DNA-binding antitoxin AbrB/MazE fold protein